MAGTLTKYAGTIKKHEDNRMVRYRQIGIVRPDEGRVI